MIRLLQRQFQPIGVAPDYRELSLAILGPRAFISLTVDPLRIQRILAVRLALIRPVDYFLDSADALFSSLFLKPNERELTQYRSPVGCGPSSKTWPRWPPHCLQRISTRFIRRLRSDFSSTFSFSAGDQKLGHPVPESNFVSDENRGAPHPAQTYIPFSLLWRYFPVKDRSVAFFLKTW